MKIFLESIPFGVVQAYSERTQENRRQLDALISDRNLWQKIASYLDLAALNALKVSCHFFEIPCDKAIVEKLNHQSNLSKIFIELTTSVKRKVPSSFHLLTAGQTAAKNFLQKIQSGVAGPFIQRLNFADSTINDQGLKVIVEKCPALTALDLSKCSITDDSILAIATHCTQLIALNLYLTGTGDVGIRAIANKCSNLRHLDLFSTDITDGGISHLARRCSHLTRLCLDQTQAGDSSLAALADGCPHLIELSLNGTDITDEGVMKISHGCTELTALNLVDTNCGKIGLNALGERCTSLTSLKTSVRLSGLELETTLSKFPKLITFYFNSIK